MGGSKRDYINKTKLEFYKKIREYQQELKPTKEIEGFGASAIVGEKNYPYLKVHNISTENKDSSYFNTSDIVKQDYSKIIELKAKNILGSTQDVYTKNRTEKITNEIQDIYKSKKAIEFASQFEKELKFDKVLVNKVSGIVGSKNPLLNLEANENTTTSKDIEKYTQEDIKSRQAIISLYEKGVNEHQIINLLALGTFGIEINKKLVPSRWAISAYDQTIEKHLHKNIVKYNSINSYEVYHAKDKGNDFVIILIPDTFSAEVIETWVEDGRPVIEADYVGVDNKLHKPQPDTAGGFYATKLPIFEHLNQRKKQASFISVRYIDGYDIPLGVVFVRETVREAMKNKIFSTSDEYELRKFLEFKFKKHFQFYKNSNVLKEQKRQKKLNQFFG